MLTAACSLVQVCREHFFLALTQQSLHSWHRCSSSSSEVRLLAGYHTWGLVVHLSLTSWLTTDYPVLREAWDAGLYLIILSQLGWLVNCHSPVQRRFVLLQLSSKQTIGKILSFPSDHELVWRLEWFACWKNVDSRVGVGGTANSGYCCDYICISEAASFAGTDWFFWR